MAVATSIHAVSAPSIPVLEPMHAL
jgi:hypothetical protein